MEIRDLYNENKELTGETILKGELFKVKKENGQQQEDIQFQEKLANKE